MLTYRPPAEDDMSIFRLVGLLTRSSLGPIESNVGKERDDVSCSHCTTAAGR